MDTRYVNALLTCIRNGVSKLKDDMFKNHIAENATCTCGDARETAIHYFFECPQYTIERNNMITEILSMDQHVHLNINTVLKGGNDFSVAENEQLHRAVSQYIISSGRF